MQTKERDTDPTCMKARSEAHEVKTPYTDKSRSNGQQVCLYEQMSDVRWLPGDAT